MAEAKKTAAQTVAATATEPTVMICLPLLPEQEMGLKVDQYEHVTINGKTTLIRRGEHVEVPVDVFIQLRNRFPNL